MATERNNSNAPQDVGYGHITIEIDNPTPQIGNPCNLFLSTLGDKYVLVLVGLPARGKSFIANRLAQYLSFFQRAKCKVFNIGNQRRELYGAKCTSDFFDPENEEFSVRQAMIFQKTVESLKKWFQTSESEFGAKVAIFDGANHTKSMRSEIYQTFRPLVESGSHIIFLEVLCDESKSEQNAKMVEHHVNLAVSSMPDYINVNRDEAVRDLRQRISFFQKLYEPLDESENDYSWVKMVDAGTQLSINNIHGFIPGKIIQFLMNLQLMCGPIYLSRHGESEYNVQHKIGGDSSLSSEGHAYAEDLARFVHTEVLNLNPDGSFKEGQPKTAPHARLFTSSLLRTNETARHIVHHECEDGWIIMRKKVLRALDEIYAGAFDGMTYEEIEKRAPLEFEARKKDKLSYRYPRGESYLDVVQRLDTVIHEVERIRDPILIVAHQGVLKIIYSYLMGLPLHEAPMVSIPLNTVLKLSPAAYFCAEERIVLRNPEVHKEPPSH